MAEAANVKSLPAADPGVGMPAIVDNPWLRQMAVMVGIAASVALGVAVVLWSQSPNYAPLYGNLAEKGRQPGHGGPAADRRGLPGRRGHRYGHGAVCQVEGDPDAVGRPGAAQRYRRGIRATAAGYRFRYQPDGRTGALSAGAIQGELARTIATIGAVHSARVHLAIPKQSVFVRKRQPPSASVALRLHNGRVLEEDQVEAVVHLVASSIPELEPGRVTVVDHKGRLLSGDSESREMKLSATQFEHTRRIEQHFRERVEGLLFPIVGRDKVRAQVTADVDFTVTEQTQERFNPEQPALRSEQLNEQKSLDAGAGGIPGALSNQPPAAGTAPQEAGAVAGAVAQGEALNSSRQSTRNFELDRVISHTRMSPISLRRLSVAVVVDDITTVGEDGTVSVRERTPEEIERLTELVREAIGFDSRRGDSVRVMNSSFLSPEPVADLPEVPIWEQGWFIDIVKQVGGLLLVLILIFFVLKPTMKRLTASHAGVAGGGGDPERARIEGPLAQNQ